VLRCEPYPVETSVRLPAAGDPLPVHIAPAPDEALMSWLCRLAVAVGLSPSAFTRHAFGIDSQVHPEWWRRPTEGQLTAISAGSGLSRNQLCGMTLESWATARNDERDERFSAWRVAKPGYRMKGGRYLAVCPRCLAGDDKPYLRTEWMIGWLAICPRHDIVLERKCPSCHRMLRQQELNGSRLADPCQCHRCSASLAEGNGSTALAGIGLQRTMLALKRAGLGHVPGLGMVEWGMFSALTDLVLRAVWTAEPVRARERLFTQVVLDLGLAPAERFRIGWRGNYGALVLMAWMLEGWPDRLGQALDLLNAPTVDELLAELPDLDGKRCIKLRQMVGSALFHRPKLPDWQAWLNGLGDAGIDLWEQAAAERHWGRKDRLIALAMLRDGQSIKEAAYRVRVSCKAVERWLDIGLGYGLDAVVAKPLRWCDLTDDQREKIAAWLIATGRTASGGTGWTADHARSEIAAQFGLLITTHAAHHLLLCNRNRSTP
jgi:transposase